MSVTISSKAELIIALKVLEEFQVHTEPTIDEVEGSEGEDAAASESLIRLYLAASHDRDIEMTKEAVLALVSELQEGALIGTKMLLGGDWAIVRVVGRNHRAEHFGQTVSYHKIETHFFECDSANVRLYLKGGVNALPVHYSKLGLAEEIFPEFGNGEMYVFAKSSAGQLSNESVSALVEAYLFEIERASGLSLRVEGFPVFDADELSWMDEKARDSLATLGGTRMRPLLVGEGLDEALELFNRACGLEHHPDHLLLGFVRVIEHVSVTVLRMHTYRMRCVDPTLHSARDGLTMPTSQSLRVVRGQPARSAAWPAPSPPGRSAPAPTQRTLSSVQARGDVASAATCS